MAIFVCPRCHGVMTEQEQGGFKCPQCEMVLAGWAFKRTNTQTMGVFMENKIMVFTCPHCNKVRKFGEFIDKPEKLLAAIAKGDVNERAEVCDECKKKTGVTNRLLPVKDKNEMQLLHGVA